MSTATTRRRIWRRAQIAAASILAGALVLSACSSNGANSAAGDNELTPITVVTFLPLESMTFAPEMIAHSGGYFTEHGLDVTLEPVRGTPAALQAVVGGAAFITRASTIDIMPAMEKGHPMVGVGTMVRKTNLRVVSTKNDPVEKPADMIGKTIGMGSIGGTSERMLDLALQHDDIERDSVERQAVPVTAATYELVRRGELGGYIVSLDTGLSIERQNDDAVLSTAGLDVTPDLQLFVTTPDNVESNPEVVKAFLAAMADAAQFIVDDRENDFAETLRILRDSGDWDFPALSDDEAARGALEVLSTEAWMDDSGTPMMHNDPERFEEAYEVLTDGGLLEGGADSQGWITNDHVP